MISWDVEKAFAIIGIAGKKMLAGNGLGRH
jgi:hypothetical protein